MKQNLKADGLKSSISPADFYRFELPNAKLKTSGWNDGGLCPFHADNKAGSFRVNVTSGAFKCFACGVQGGDIIAYTMALHGLDFVGTLNRLATEWVAL